ncbi:transferrin-binding protein-like solute binding protein [Tabrizicola sp.]|uniref:transferrin-binding protein-like solute binding protein n=1 Tax=Tabrizicola sp. TaxID=2005166 RepID=UPI00273512E6|nr:transferrin-binding protein-like solute binding protein [Tabrizicola sp.]MDP3195418.1 transferrin-binding protein-like solute binding protein [Tabrizicola sp.]
MKNIHTISAMLLGTTLIAACGGGSGSGGPGVTSRSGNSDADRVLAVEAGNAAEALEAGATLKASQRASSGWTRTFDAATARLTADSTASVTLNDEGGLDLTIGGQTIRFIASDLTEDGNGFELPDGTAGIWSWDGESIADALDPAAGRYSLVFDYYSDNEDGTGRNGFLVVGTETADADLRALPTATYQGYARIRVAPTTGFNDYAADVSEARGDVTMVANFGAGTVSGAVTNMAGRAPRLEDPTRTWTPFDGGLTMEQAAITGNGFTGAITADAGFAAAVGTIDAGSSYSGTFFGPGGEEVGGGINVTGTGAEDGQGYLGFGHWRAWQQ